jgi:alkylation response protein AidB-like acyl-CoA dehydrogenase
MEGAEMDENDLPDLQDFLNGARAWLDENAVLAAGAQDQQSDRVSIFGSGDRAEERERFELLRRWERKKHDAGYGAISWPKEFGGAGLTRAYEDAFDDLEREYVVPEQADVLTISRSIESPTIRAVGTDEQKARWLPALLRSDLVFCQLFSEPGAGSDLGSLSLSSQREGDDWVLNGQKVWTSGAHLATHGVVLTRSSRDVPRREAFTVFVVPMDAPGITIRPIRQMTDTSGFNEVFFDDVRVPDEDRLGEAGTGWAVAMTILGFERTAAARDLGSGGTVLFDRLVELARRKGCLEDPRIMEALTDLYVRNRTRTWAAERVLHRAGGDVPGPETSILKLSFTRELSAAGEIAADVLGPAFTADTGEWGTFAWSDLVCGVPGIRLGGGTDEIQKTTLAERVLGMPKEKR